MMGTWRGRSATWKEHVRKLLQHERTCLQEKSLQHAMLHFKELAAKYDKLRALKRIPKWPVWTYHPLKEMERKGKESNMKGTCKKSKMKTTWKEHESNACTIKGTWNEMNAKWKDNKRNMHATCKRTMTGKECNMKGQWKEMTATWQENERNLMQHERKMIRKVS